MRIYSLIAVSLFFTLFINAQSHWETVVFASDTWSYLEATSEPDASWNQTGFDDSLWPSAPGGFGYADNDDATITDTINSVYIRTIFNIIDSTVIENIMLNADYDDAFVAYINGVEVARSANITDEIPVFNSILTIDHEASMYQGGSPESFLLDSSLVNDGENLLAIQIINVSTQSSDMSSNFFLHIKLNTADTTYSPTPDWFREPITFAESDMPIIMINTLGQGIKKKKKITAHMGIINNSSGINFTSDSLNEYDGAIGIEVRGSSSQMFEKKNFTIETRTDTGSNNNVVLLDMPKENDWVLHGPYSDKSLMRNALAYKLGTTTGQWAPRSRFCELYINDQYQGVYVLMEKIKRDNNRLDIAKLNPDEIAGDDLSGGYLLKIDRPDEGYWVSPYKGENGFSDINISYVEPEYSEMVQIQRDYIKNFITDFEDALFGTDFNNPATGYQAYIDMTSFADHFLINELSKNVDAYRLSAFFYKEKDSKGGKLHMGPIWDYNLGFGNADYYDGANTQGWVIHGIPDGDGFQPPFWWEKLRQSPEFNIVLRDRWLELRASTYNMDYIENYIDSVTTLIENAQQRNFQVFPILGQYIWPNSYIGNSYANEIDFLKTWIEDRITWMDSQLEQIPDISSITEYANSYEVYPYPNPFTESLTFKVNLVEENDIQIILTNLLGQTIFEGYFIGHPGLNELSVEGFSESGILIYTVLVDDAIERSGKVIRK